MLHLIEVNYKTVVSLVGTLKLLAVGAFGSAILVAARDQDYIVYLAPQAAILNLLWLHASLEQFQIGDTIRVHGTMNADATIIAPIIRNISIR